MTGITIRHRFSTLPPASLNTTMQVVPTVSVWRQASATSPCRYLNLFGNWSYIEGKFNDKDDNGNTQLYAGNRFRLTPKNSFAIGFDLNVPAGEKASFYLRPTYSWKSKVFFEESNEPEFTQDAYGLLNFTAGYRFQPGKVYYEIGAFGKNVLDEK